MNVTKVSDNIDLNKPVLDYSGSNIIFIIYRVSWMFPKVIAPKILGYFLRIALKFRVNKFKNDLKSQVVLRKLADKMGVPTNCDKTLINLKIYRDLAETPFYAAHCTSGELNLEYAQSRGQITIENMCETAKVFTSDDWKSWKPDILSDELLHHTIFNQTISYFSIKSDLPEYEFKIQLHALDVTDQYPFGFHDVRKIYSNLNDNNMMIEMQNGDQIRNGDKYWEIAKLAAASSIYYYTLYYAHNWVHVNYPDVVMAKTYSMISKKSVFFKLMYPHIRYGIMTNSNGISGRTTSRNVGVYCDYIRPEVAVLVYQSEFAEGLIRRALTFTSGEDIPIAKDIFESKLRLNFPHTGFKDSPIPYLQKLYRLYVIIRDFVEKIYTAIPSEHDSIELWKKSILKLFPHLNTGSVNTVDFIATFIWHASFIHSIDHETTAAVFYRNGKTPLCLRNNFSLKKNMTLKDMYSPIDLLSGWGVGNSFLAFVRNDKMDDSMEALNYKFTSENLIKIQNEFKEKLRAEMTNSWRFIFKKDKAISLTLKNIATSISY